MGIDHTYLQYNKVYHNKHQQFHISKISGNPDLIIDSSNLIITSDSVDICNNLTVLGDVSAATFYGDGSNLTGIDALPDQSGNNGKLLISDGSNATWSSDISVNNIDITGNITATNNSLKICAKGNNNISYDNSITLDSSGVKINGTNPTLKICSGTYNTDPEVIIGIDSISSSSEATGLSQHVYFGWAPTWTSSNNLWQPYQIKIEQNGIDIVDNESITYLLQPSGIANTNENTGTHFCEYTSSQIEWHGSHTSPSYWETNKKPLLYRKTNIALDGSQLVAKQSCRAGHWPKHGYIVSAADPAGPWIIRGGWFDQDGMTGGYNDFVESPLSMTHESDTNGWRKVTEVPRGQYINDPFSGTTQSSTIPVEVPIVAMSDVEEYGRDIEVKVVITYGGTDYEMHYKNWMLKYVFDHTWSPYESEVVEFDTPNNGYRGKDVCCARPGPESGWTSGQWETDNRGVKGQNSSWNWRFSSWGNHRFDSNCGFLLHADSGDADRIWNGPDWGMGQQSHSTNWTKIVIYARKLLSVNDISYNNGNSDPSTGHYDSGQIDLMYSQQSNHPTSWRWGNYQYQNLPAWIEAKMPLWGTSHVNKGDTVPIIFRQKTEVIMFTNEGWSPPWDGGGPPQYEWTRTSDPRGIYFNQGTSNHVIYTKTFEPGSHNIDTNSAMYLFAPVHEALELPSTTITTTNNLTFIGSKTEQELLIKTNNIERFRIGTSGQFGISGENYGSVGQLLSSTGPSSAPSWIDPPISLPDQSGNNGKLLITDGSNATWSSDISVNNINISATLTVSGDVSAATFYGDGSNLTGLSSGATSLNDLSDCKSGGTNFTRSLSIGVLPTSNNNLENNVMIGFEAGLNISSKQNVAIGTYAYKNGAGAYNTAVGYAAMLNGGGYNQVAFGKAALLNSTGSDNCAIGRNALSGLTSGGFNCALGHQAGSNLVSGSYNVIIGRDTYTSANNSQHEIVIGSNTTGNGTNTVTIGHSSVTNTYLRGNLHINNNYSLPSTSGTAGQILKFPSSTTTINNNATYLLEWGDAGPSLTNYSDASFNNVDISGNLLANGKIKFFQNNQQIVAADPSGILTRIDNLDNSLNSLLTSNNDASFNNVDVSGSLNVQGEKVITVPSLDICGNALTPNTTYEITTGPAGSINNISFNLTKTKVFMRMHPNNQTGNIYAQTISNWNTPHIFYPNNMYVSSDDIFRPPRNGYYFITFNTSLKSTTGNSTYAAIRLRKNGTIEASAREAEANDQGFNPKHRFLNVSSILYITTTDKIRLEIQADNQYKLEGGPDSIFTVHNVD